MFCCKLYILNSIPTSCWSKHKLYDLQKSPFWSRDTCGWLLNSKLTDRQKTLTWKDFWLLLGNVWTPSEAVDKLCDLPQPPASRTIDLELSKGGKKVGIPRFPRIVTDTVFWGCSRAIPRNHPGLFRHSRLLCLSYPQRYRCVEIFWYTGRRTTAAVSHTQEMIPFLRCSLPECFV